MRILLVSADFFKAEGAIAKGIVQALPNDTIFFFSVHEFKYRLDEFTQLMNRVDIVHWLFNVGNLDERYVHLFTNSTVPQIATVHHVCPDELNKIYAASKTNLIHVVSNEWKTFIEERCKVPVVMAPLGFTKPYLKEKQKVWDPNNLPVIGMSGFYPGKNNRKRIDVALAVLKKLKRDIEFELIVQGKGWNDCYNEFQENNIKYNHLSLTSHQKALDFYEKIDIYLCTSDYEGGPFPILEAMAYGVPVVSTKVGMAIDLVHQGGGFICEKEDVNCLMEKLKLCMDDHEKYESLSRQAKLIAHNYKWEHLNLPYEHLYHETIGAWEKANKATWNYAQGKIINANHQREKQLAHDRLSQSVIFIQEKRYSIGLAILFSGLIQRHISWNRKLAYLKKVVSILIA